MSVAFRLSPNDEQTVSISRDVMAGLVVFLVALPLCLGVALASGAPLLSGILAGVVGGILVGLLSGSQSSVSGPAAGLTAVVAAQIASLGSFQALLLAVILAGAIQIALGLAQAGFLASFFPSSVIKGLLAAIGVILILKQIPHLFGYDANPIGDFAFQQLDKMNTFSELKRIVGNTSSGATTIGLLSLAVLVIWDGWKLLKHSVVPAPLVVVLLGVGISLLFRRLGLQWDIEQRHMVQVPVASSLSEFIGFIQWPDFAQWNNPAVYIAALTIAAVASLETLLNLEAVDKLDPHRRTSPPSRELLAQGIGNIVAGFVGGLPITSVVIRGSVNLNAGAKTKLSTVVHGALLLVSVAFLPVWLNHIPLSCLAAILLFTGAKLISPEMIKKIWSQGRYQFIPFATTVLAIVFTDLLIGVLIGLAVSLSFILHSSMRRPIRQFVEKHMGGDVVHVELANQVSFLNRAALKKTLDDIRSHGEVLLDAHHTDYVDPDVLDLIREFKEVTGPARGVKMSLLGFRSEYELNDRIQYLEYSTRKLQSSLTSQQALQILNDGHERFRSGRRLSRDLDGQVSATATGQHPLAVVLSCIDSRTPAELIFDLGLGDILSVRIAGNVISRKVLGSVEYGCVVAGAKLVLVMGHTRCGAVTAVINLIGQSRSPAEVTGCQHIGSVVREIQQSTEPPGYYRGFERLAPAEQESIVDAVARRNVLRVVAEMREQSRTLDHLVRENQIAIVGAMYDVITGEIEFFAS